MRAQACVPRISTFYGIVIAMYREHPPPHFHAWHGGWRASISVETLAILSGSLPPRVLRLVREWALMHRIELNENWQRARRGQALIPIEPLA